MTPRTQELHDRTPTAGTGLGIVWEEVPCPVCGAGESGASFEAADNSPATSDPNILAGKAYRFLVVRCQTCGLSYTNPRPDSTTIGRFYPSDYKPHRQTRPGIKSRRVKTYPLERLLGRPCRERRGRLPWPGTGRLLDFGCGNGSFLKRMADLGWDVQGIDPAVEAVERIRSELGLSATVGTFPHPDLRPCSFEVITMWHALEHTHDPMTVLREAYRLLIPGGKLIVATPNIDSWSFRHFGPAWYGLDLPRHLIHFTPHTLTLALQSAGLRPSCIKLLSHSRWLNASARMSLRLKSPAGWFNRILTWKPAARMIAWFAYMFSQSDCMLTIAERPG